MTAMAAPAIPSLIPPLPRASLTGAWSLAIVPLAPVQRYYGEGPVW